MQSLRHLVKHALSHSTFFRPKLFECLHGYTAANFSADLNAGITVGIIALPLAMAFGIASGVTPAAGIFTAIIAGFLISAFGGSRVQVGGPTGAFVVIVYNIIASYGLANLLVCTMMAGCILITMGLALMGTIIRYIPRPVTIGFTNGIAVLIAGTQIKDFFGIQVTELPAEFFEKLSVLARHFDTLHIPTLAVSIASLALLILWPKQWAKRIPASIIVVIFSTCAVIWLKLPIETIGSKFGGIPQGFPPFAFPVIHWEHLDNLVSPAVTIALLAAIESLLSAVVADGMIDDKHDSNQELIGQGIANLLAPLFGGIPATGAIARTATNVKTGAVSPISGIVHACTLLVVLLIAAPLAYSIPLASLSAVLIMVAFNMGEWEEFRAVPRMPKSDSLVLLTTFGLTVIFDLTVAVEVGMILSALLFIKRIADTTQVTLIDEKTATEGDHPTFNPKEIPEGVLVFRIFGALMFGAADKLENVMLHQKQEPKVMILRMRTVLAMDTTALNTLERLYAKLHRHGKYLILSGAHTQPYCLMQRSGFIDQLGANNVVTDIHQALARAQELLQGQNTQCSVQNSNHSQS